MENIMPSGFKKPIGDLPTQDLSLFVKSKLIPFFFQLLGQGFLVNAPTNCSIRDLIIDCLGIPDDYLEERIQTLFLNGSVVDDLNSCNIKEGSTLALSGAMPGLAGAVLCCAGEDFMHHFAVQSHLMTANPGLIKTIIGLSSNYST